MPIAEAIRNAQRSGSWIRKMFEEGTSLKKQYGSDKVYDFSLGNPDIEPPEAFHRVLNRLAAEDPKGSHGYMSNPGFPEVREALARKVSREQGVSIDGSRIVMSVGAAGALNTVLKAILNPNDEVIVSRPYFVEYGSYISNHGGKMVLVDSQRDFNLDPAAIAGALSTRTAAVLINSPHNPTGRVYPRQTIASLAEVLEAHGKKTGRYPYLIADEPYREIVYGDTVVPPVLSAYGESIIVTSYSKSLSLPGERIGYIALGPELRDAVEVAGALAYATRVLGYVNAPALMQRVVAELTDERVDVGIYERRRDAFKRVLDKAGIPYSEPQGAFYLFCQVPRSKKAESPQPGGPVASETAQGDDIAFVNHLKNHLILGVPGSGFGAPGFFRLAYCVDEGIINASEDAFRRAVETWNGTGV